MHQSLAAPSTLLTGRLLALSLAAGAVMTGLAAGAVVLLGLPMGVLALSVALFIGVMALAIAGVRTHHPHARLGPANLVTTARAALVALVAGLVLPRETAAEWLVVVVASVAACLDGLDGQLARRTGLGSAFGARFDMEVDALLILLLSAGVWWTGKAGAWVLLSGLLRYGFIVAGWTAPWMERALPDSFRRKTICVIQIVGLIVAIAPIVAAPLASAIAGATLVLLAWSFAVDVAWLFQQRAATPPR